MKKAFKTIICCIAAVLVVLFALSSCSTDLGYRKTNDKLLDSSKPVGEILKLYTTAYNNTKANADFFGTGIISLADGTLNLEGIYNQMLNNIVQGIIEEISPSGKRIKLPEYGALYFGESDVTFSEFSEDENMIVLNLKMGGINVIDRFSNNESLVRDLDLIDEAMVNQGISWADGRELKDCCHVMCDADATIVIDKSDCTFLRADYVLKLFVNLDHVNFGGIFFNRSGGATVNYEMLFPAG